MNIYLISQTEVSGYETYDSAVVIANDENEARNMNPGGDWNSKKPYPGWTGWCKKPESVKVVCIGTANDNQSAGFVCKSFNAG